MSRVLTVLLALVIELDFGLALVVLHKDNTAEIGVDPPLQVHEQAYVPEPPVQRLTEETKAEIDEATERFLEAEQPVYVEQPVHTEQEEYYVEEPIAEEGGYEVENFESAGVLQDENYTYTYYSQNVLPGLEVPGKYVDENGIVRDENGYAVVASTDYEYGTVIEGTLFGTAKVYDTGYLAEGQLDVYTDF